MTEKKREYTRREARSYQFVLCYLKVRSIEAKEKRGMGIDKIIYSHCEFFKNSFNRKREREFTSIEETSK